VPKIVHSGKPSLSAVPTLGEDLTPLVPSGFFYKKISSLSATLGEEICFFKKLFPGVILGEEFF
jgi:hypothetical protein